MPEGSFTFVGGTTDEPFSYHSLSNSGRIPKRGVASSMVYPDFLD